MDTGPRLGVGAAATVVIPDRSPARWCARRLRDARRVAVLTGAGMSADSGVPTFRDAQTGWWARFDPQELATEAAFRRTPARVFGWYLHRLRAVRAVAPHAGYHALVRIGRHFPAGFSVITQNVDGLHARAGSDGVVELHGSIDGFRCLDLGHPYDVEAVLALETNGSEGEVAPPRCHCGSPIRPGVVWFGEALPEAAFRAGAKAAEEADVLLVVGTSCVVYPAAGLATAARARGATLVEINPDRTPLTPSVDLHWPAPARIALTELSTALNAPDSRVAPSPTFSRVRAEPGSGAEI